MTVMLVAAPERSVSDVGGFRESALRTDAENLQLNPLFSSFINRYRENLGLAALAAYLRAHNVTTELISGNLDARTPEEIARHIIELAPEVVGFSIIYELHLVNSLEIIRAIRRDGYRGHVLLGGQYATFIHEPLLLSAFGIDSVIRGEGELPLLRLVQALRTGQDWRSIPGLAYYDGTSVRANPAGLIVRDLDELPFAARDSLSGLQARGLPTRTASIYSSRGCLGHCTYCTAPASKSLSPVGWRCRSGEALFAEIKDLIERFGVEYFYFCDVNFIGYGPAARERLETFCNLVEESGLRFSFHAEARADSIERDLGILRRLRGIGLKDLLLGLETGSPRLLKLWKKRTPLEKNVSAVRHVRALGFDLEPAMIMVGPETRTDDLVATIDFILAEQLHREGVALHLFNKMALFKGTEAEERMVSIGSVSGVDIDRVRSLDNSDDGLVALCREVAARPYVTESAVVDDGWALCMTEVDRLTWLLQEYIPDILNDFMRNRTAQDAVGRAELMATLASARRWRDGIADLVETILRLLREYLVDDTHDAGRLARGLREAVDEHEQTCFGRLLPALGDYQRAAD